MKGILGYKLGMTRLFTQQGQMVPVTVIQVEPNVVLQAKTTASDGYDALKIAMGERREALFNRPDAGQFKKITTKPRHHIREIRDMTGFKVGDTVSCDIFTVGEYVDVQAISKGKGFAGVIKRHNQSRGPKSHGSHYHRAPGSMGPIAPNRVPKGKRLPGHMGHELTTVQGLPIVIVEASQQLIAVRGSVPGPRRSLVVVRATSKRNDKKYKVE